MAHELSPQRTALIVTRNAVEELDLVDHIQALGWIVAPVARDVQAARAWLSEHPGGRRLVIHGLPAEESGAVFELCDALNVPLILLDQPASPERSNPVTRLERPYTTADLDRAITTVTNPAV